ncbi:MAG: hypothetical protein ACK56J_17085 [Planctomycetota bacterium]|jgi:hypothetical protein
MLAIRLGGSKSCLPKRLFRGGNFSAKPRFVQKDAPPGIFGFFRNQHRENAASRDKGDITRPWFRNQPEIHADLFGA